MLRTGILNPSVLSLLARVRHTNTLAIADRGFPFWPQVETIDLSLIDDIPTVRQVLDALWPNFVVGRAFLAEEFASFNPPEKLAVCALPGGAFLTEWNFEAKARWIDLGLGAAV